MSTKSSKPRKKPQFLHLHPIQGLLSHFSGIYCILNLHPAAKAKQAWVNKAKLRSQWAKQKRKLPADASDEHQEMDVDTEGDNHEQLLEEPVEEVKEPVAGASRKRKRLSRSEEKAAQHKPAALNQPSVPVDERERRGRVRELSRKAYAPESLHTFKADPLHRQRSQSQTSSRGRAPGTRNISQFSRGRGQPNMKLRMNALLEKIKLDAGVS